MTRSRETGDVGYRAYKKNYLINGDMSVWQRGTVGLGPNAYTADRWFQFTGAVVNREETTAFGGKDYIAEIVGSALSTIGQAIELKGAGFNLVPAGKSLTFSGWIFAPVGQTVQLITVYRDAIESVANQVVDASIASLTVGTGAWQYVTHTWVSNAVPNPTNNQYTMLLTFSAAGTYYIGKLQIEEGAIAKPFIHTPIGETLALCQRYYAKTYDQDTAPATATAVSALGCPCPVAGWAYALVAQWSFPVTMRIVPSVTAYNSAGTPDACNIDAGSAPARIGNTSQQACSVTINNNATAGLNSFLSCHITADAEL